MPRASQLNFRSVPTPREIEWTRILGRWKASGLSGRAFCGRTTLGSGSASVTVSTGVINSNSMFRLASIVGSTALGANSGGGVVVNSIVSGVSFALARPTGTAVAWSDIVSWEIVRTGMK